MIAIGRKRKTKRDQLLLLLLLLLLQRRKRLSIGRKLKIEARRINVDDQGGTLTGSPMGRLLNRSIDR